MGLEARPFPDEGWPPLLGELAEEAATCTRCGLHESATQTVFGVGSAAAPMMLVGEQPGDEEDREGRPFVGPAGKLLDRALEEAGIDRDAVYVTNVVKHFKWRPAGKVRLHQKPNAQEVGACRMWWEWELALLQPRVLGCLGATAARAVLGARFRVTKRRGEFVELPSGVLATGTIHPSAILRIGETRQREAEFARFVEDLEAMAARLAA